MRRKWLTSGVGGGLPPCDAGAAHHHHLRAAAGDAEIVVVDEGERAVVHERHAFGLADDAGMVRAVEPQRLLHWRDFGRREVARFRAPRRRCSTSSASVCST